MKGFVSGLLLSCAIAAIALAGGLLHFNSPCEQYCGQGTICENQVCVVANEPDQEDVDKSSESKRKTKRKRGRKRSRDSKHDNDSQAARNIPWDKDNDVPDFDLNASRSIEMNQGSERLDSHAVNRALRSLDPAFESCVSDASTRSGGQLQPGKVRIQFGVSGSGKATGVRARAPSHLKKFGIVPCVRRSIFDHRFPTFDGPESRIETSFEVQ